MASKTIIATRMELLKLKKKIKLAQKGHKLLKEKRDALIGEFFTLMEGLKTQRKDVDYALEKAFKSLSLSTAISGSDEIKRAAYSTDEMGEIVQKKNTIMGVSVPIFEFESKIDRKYSHLSTNVELDTASRYFDKALNKMVKLAELEATATKLADEIKKTKRKVNALEQRLIPNLNKDIIYIKMRLEEMERENFSRLKVIKKRIEA